MSAHELSKCAKRLGEGIDQIPWFSVFGVYKLPKVGTGSETVPSKSSKCFLTSEPFLQLLWFVSEKFLIASQE